MTLAVDRKELKRYAKDEVILRVKSTQSAAQQSEDEEEEKPSKKNQYEDDEMDELNEEGKRQYHGGRSEQAYDDPDVEDVAFIKASMETLEIGDESDTDEDNNSTKKPTKRKQSEPDEEPVNKVKNTSSTSSNAVINEDALKCELVLTFPLNSAKLPMLNIAEQCAAYSAIRKKDGIEKCYISDAQSGVDYAVQTDGINFAAAWESSDLIDVDNIQCNDVHTVLRTYGVEAARTVIVKECKGVFGAYGIEVNPRHLGLIADHMTNQGIYKGCNFSGIKTQSSPILKMSFERCTHFIREATLAGEYDPIRSPSSRIAVGRPPLVGTGCMDVISYPPEQS
eukprot:g2769.t1